MSNKLEAALGEIAGTFPMQKIATDWAEKEFAPAPVEPNSFRDSATGGTWPPIEFVDKQDDVYRAERFDFTDDDSTIELSRYHADGEAHIELVFFKADAAKIIALIQEAAK